MRSEFLAILLVIAGCASGTMPATGTSETTQHHEHNAELLATAGPGYTIADVRFMQNMIGHHAQALVMTELAPARTVASNILALAQKIDISQRDEIEMMKAWLRERKQAVPDETTSPHMMPGMLTTQQMAQLGAARGREFDLLFLSFMIRHHQGALQMVEELFRDGNAGQDPDLFRLVTDVEADQRDEIFVMERLLDNMREEPR